LGGGIKKKGAKSHRGGWEKEGKRHVIEFQNLLLPLDMNDVGQGAFRGDSRLLFYYEKIVSSRRK